MSETLDHIFQDIPLRSFVRVQWSAAMMSVLTDIGLREEKSWGDDEEELLEKLLACARLHEKYMLDTLAEFGVNLNTTRNDLKKSTFVVLDVQGSQMYCVCVENQEKAWRPASENASVGDVIRDVA